MKWFGDPYPSREERAPVYESDDDEVPVPVGETCVACKETIDATARGLLLPYFVVGDETYVAYHRACFLRTILPADMAKLADA